MVVFSRSRAAPVPRIFPGRVDAWYATGRFIKAVQRLCWGVVAVLKQKHYEICGEATRLSAQLPTQAHEWKGRRVMLQGGQGPPVHRRAEESWNQNQRINGKKIVVSRQNHWRWLVDRSLDPYSAQIIHAMGHQR